MSSDPRNGRRDDRGGGRREGGQGGRRFIRARKSCKFCADKVDYIDYKDGRLLGRLHTRARQNIASANIGHLYASSADAGDRDQTGAQRRDSAFRNRLSYLGSVSPWPRSTTRIDITESTIEEDFNGTHGCFAL